MMDFLLASDVNATASREGEDTDNVNQPMSGNLVAQLFQLLWGRTRGTGR
jgi:hypothetical protein